MGTKVTIGQMRALARARGGACLSTKYVNAQTKLRWKCAKGHAWEATPGSVKNAGNWCLKCAGRAPLTLEQMQAVAKKRGGKCLSTTYVNS